MQKNTRSVLKILVRMQRFRTSLAVSHFVLTRNCQIREIGTVFAFVTLISREFVKFVNTQRFCINLAVSHFHFTRKIVQSNFNKRFTTKRVCRTVKTSNFEIFLT